MKPFIMVVLVALIALTGVPFAQAAEPSNPGVQLPQPVGAKRFFSQFELRSIYAYRLGDPTKVEFMESPGGAAGGGAGSGDASGGGDAGSAGTAASGPQ